MTASEKFCLKGNDFKKNVSTSFASLRDDTNLSDVTLVCEDGQQLVAHKVILAASSPFFQNLFTRNKHEHPLIYMRGIEFDDLLAIVDFLYYGEANIYQHNLDKFLNIAQELSLKGLNRDTDPNVSNLKVETSPTKTHQPFKPQVKLQHKNTPKNQDISLDLDISLNHDNDERTVVLSKQALSGDLEELEERVKSMMALSDKVMPNGIRRPYSCQVCGKEGYNTSIKDHIEANHMEGIIVPCNLCEKTFRSRASLRYHRLHQH